MPMLALLILVHFSACCQSTIKKEIYPIEELTVINYNLFSALDTIIQMKEALEWYKGTRFFLIEFDIDSMKPDLIFIRAYEKISYRYPNIIGFFDYKQHSFVITGNSIDTTIFQKTSKERNFEFGLPPKRYTKKGELIFNTGTFAVWSIRYKLDKFKILSFFTDNKNDPWLDNVDAEYNKK